MRQFNNYEAVKINNAEEAMEFLQYLEDNTDLRWYEGFEPTAQIITKGIFLWEFPVFIELYEDDMCIVKQEDELEDETKIIPLSEFLNQKTTYTREQAEKVFHNYDQPLDRTDIEFLDQKFPKSTLEQVTEAVKDLRNFKIEETTSGEIIISPINNK